MYLIGKRVIITLKDDEYTYCGIYKGESEDKGFYCFAKVSSNYGDQPLLFIPKYRLLDMRLEGR